MHGTFLHTAKVVLAATALALFVAALSSLGGFPSSPAAEAGTDDNVSGFAWSSNIGWISFNCATPDAGDCNPDYGVAVAPPDGTSPRPLSGHAWNSAIGWISFNQTQTSGFPQSPQHGARLNADDTVTGWARACAVFENECSGDLKSDTARGGWDGWIKMSKDASDTGANYGVTYDSTSGEFDGHAWGGDVVGWISFNCKTGGVGGGDVCSASDYKVALGATAPPAETPLVTLTAQPSVENGSNADIEWTVLNVTEDCVGTDTNSGDLTTDWWSGRGGTVADGNGGGPESIISVGPINGTVTYTLTCGSVSDFVEINVNPFIAEFSANIPADGIFEDSVQTATLSWITTNFNDGSCALSGEETESGLSVSCTSEVPCTKSVGPWDSAGTKTYTLTCTQENPSFVALPKTATVPVKQSGFILAANPNEVGFLFIGEGGVGGGDSRKTTISVDADTSFTQGVTLSVESAPPDWEGKVSYHFSPPGETSGGAMITLSPEVGAEKSNTYTKADFWLTADEELPARTSNLVTIQGTSADGLVERYVIINIDSRAFNPEYREF